MGLEFVFFLYFLMHIPVAIFNDFQAVLPEYFYPQAVRNVMLWYCKEFKDPIILDPPAWFQSFILCEITMQFPFFFVGMYAFYKGNCKWIRIPTIVYSSHVTTAVFAILAHILRHDFSNSIHPGPETMKERLKLCSMYAPFFVVPLLMLHQMLFNKKYTTGYTTSSKQKVK